MPPLAAIFDMDGLLLDTEYVARLAWRSAADGFGIDLHDDIYRTLIGLNARDVDRRMSDVFGARYSPADFRPACVRFTHDYFETNGVPVKRGAPELLTWLQSKSIQLAVATSTDRRDAEYNLDRAGLLPFFGALSTGDQVILGKPHPEIYLRAAALLNVEPRSCIAFEDSHAGVRAASSAGMTVYLIPDLIGATDEIALLAAGVFASLTDAHSHLEQIIR